MKRRLFWLPIVVIAFALIGLVIFWIYLHSQNTYQPIGDELFDRYAKVLLNQAQQDGILQDVSEASKAHEQNEKLPYDPSFLEASAIIATWEDEYAGDPRYWQLVSTSAWFDLTRYQEAEGQLRSLLDAGETDEGCYLAIDYADLYKREPDITLNMIRQAIATHPDNAYFHYLLASLLYSEEKYGDALDALNTGNAAARSDTASIFLFNAINQHPEWFKNRANQAVAGAISRIEFTWLLRSNAMSLYSNVSGFLEHFDCEKRPEVADELITYLLRVGQQGRHKAWTVIVTTGSIDSVLEYMQAHGPELTAQQDAELAQIRTRIADANQICFKYISAPLNTSGSKMQRDISFWQNTQHLTSVAEEYNQLLRILNPPPFAAWARGELVFADK